MLLRLHATAHERGGTVTLVRPPDMFLRVLAVTTMGERFRIRETDEDVSAPDRPASASDGAGDQAVTTR